MANTEDTAQPNWKRPELVAVAKDLTLVHDLLEGTSQMHRKSGTYIRKWTDEDKKVYDIRRKSENLFEGLERTLSAATGMLFAKPPMIEWNAGEAEVQKHWTNIDAAGTAGHVFAKRFAEACVRDGLAAILVDFPPPPAQIGEDGKRRPVEVHAGNEESFNLRPRWAMYGRANIINWRTAVVDNETVLSMIVFYEPGEVEAGAFGVRAVERYRVLRLTPAGAMFSLYEKTDGSGDQDDFNLIASGAFRDKSGRAATRLPVAIGYAGRTDTPMVAKIPLLGVAHSNLAHWRTSTNLAFYSDLAAFPQPTVIGELEQQVGQDGTMVPGRVKVGPMVVIHLKQDGEFKWTELTGSSIEVLQDRVAKKLEEMSQQGLSFLVSDTRAAETAEAKRLDATAENSTLATAAQGIEDAVNMAYVHHAWYLGISAEQAPVMSLSRDFESTNMDPQTMAAYVNAVDRAGFPVRLLLEAWQQGGRIPPDQDLEELELEMMANAEAKRREREMALEAQREREERVA